jgi:hypothetical protein
VTTNEIIFHKPGDTITNNYSANQLTLRFGQDFTEWGTVCNRAANVEDLDWFVNEVVFPGVDNLEGRVSALESNTSGGIVPDLETRLQAIEARLDQLEPYLNTEFTQNEINQMQTVYIDVKKVRLVSIPLHQMPFTSDGYRLWINKPSYIDATALDWTNQIYGDSSNLIFDTQNTIASLKFKIDDLYTIINQFSPG